MSVLAIADLYVCVFAASDADGIAACAMYDKMPGDAIDGTLVPTPPRRSAEALSRRTLLWVFGWNQLAPSNKSLKL